MAFACPNCRASLVRTRVPKGSVWICRKCGGRMAGVALLRNLGAGGTVNALWVRAGQPGVVRGRPCSVCHRPMAEVPISVTGAPLKLDVCRRCHVAWFDPREYEHFVPREPLSRQADLSPKAREAVARFEADRVDRRSGEGAWNGEGPDEWWKFIPAVLGMPVQYDHPVQHVPWATWGLTALVTFISILAFQDLESAVMEYGLIPALLWRRGGLTLITSFLLHGGIMHLVGNMYFLMTFGNNVEDVVGKGRFMLLVLLATVAGGLLHSAMASDPDIPCIGASGGISGVIVFYALRFPRAKLGFLFHYFYVFRWLTMPAWTALVLWMLLQLFMAYLQHAGLSNVSAFGHLGGAAVGLAFWLAWRKN